MRWCLRICDDSPTGAAGCGTDLMVDSRGAGTDENRGARTHLASSSFRAFRFATRYPCARRGRCPHRPVAEAPSTTGQRQRKEAQDVSLTSPGQKSSQGQRVSVSDCRKGQPTFPRRRQEGCASADRPTEAFFLFGPCNHAAVGGSAALRMRHTPCWYGPFLFWQDQRWGPRRAPRGGERRSKGAGAVFAAGGNGA